MEACDANPQLDQSFTGIERFLSTSFISGGHARGWYQLKTPVGAAVPYSIDRKELRASKGKLAERFSHDAKESDLGYIKPLLEKIRHIIVEANESVH